MDPFVEYYAQQSVTPEAVARFQRLYELILRVRKAAGGQTERMAMLDIGCNTGTQTLMWADFGQLAHGLEINADLLAIAEQRRRERGLTVDFRLGSATSLPWPADSMDACLMPELLEHVPEWQDCLDEAIRVLRPGGVLYLSTTNRLCPNQMEFELPLYGWYPRRLKKHFEKLAVTTRPELVNHAKFPAVNWFTPYELKHYLQRKNFAAYDHFDCLDLEGRSGLARTVIEVIRRVPPVRWLAHVATPYSMIIAVRQPS